MNKFVLVGLILILHLPIFFVIRFISRAFLIRKEKKSSHRRYWSLPREVRKILDMNTFVLLSSNQIAYIIGIFNKRAKEVKIISKNLLWHYKLGVLCIYNDFGQDTYGKWRNVENLEYQNYQEELETFVEQLCPAFKDIKGYNESHDVFLKDILVLVYKDFVFLKCTPFMPYREIE